MIRRHKANKPATAFNGLITADNLADRLGFAAKSTDLGATLIQIDSGQVFRVVATSPTRLINAAPSQAQFVVGVDPNRYLYTEVPPAMDAAGVEQLATGIPQTVYLTPNVVGVPWQLGDLFMPNFTSLIGDFQHRWGFPNPVTCQGRIVIGDGTGTGSSGSNQISQIAIDNRGTASAGGIFADKPGGISTVVIDRCEIRTDIGPALDGEGGDLFFILENNIFHTQDVVAPAGRIINTPAGFPVETGWKNNFVNVKGGRALELIGVNWGSDGDEFACAAGLPPISMDNCATSFFRSVFSNGLTTGTVIDTVASSIFMLGLNYIVPGGPNLVDGPAGSAVWWGGSQFRFAQVSPSVPAAIAQATLDNQFGAIVPFP